MTNKLTVREYSDLKSISESTVKNYIKNKKIKAIQENGKYFIITKDAKRIIPNEERVLKKEISLLKKETRRLKMIISEKEDAGEEVKRLTKKIETLETEFREDLKTANKNLAEANKALVQTVQGSIALANPDLIARQN